MDEESPESVTQLLRRWSDGDEEAGTQVFPLLYDELHRIAALTFRNERQHHTLQATAIIHEAYLTLAGEAIEWHNRAHFFGVMARVMRRVLVDHARHRARKKRGGGAEKIPLSVIEIPGQVEQVDMAALDDALQDLESIDPEKARIVELRFFGGMTIEETAKALKLSESTVVRQWRRAKAWLLKELSATER